MTVALDHVGVVTRDIAALAAQYERLGFSLTPLALQAGGRIGNRCAMLHRSYIELLAVADAQAGSVTLERFLARYAGIHILAFAIPDEQAALARLRRAGFAAAAAAEFERSVDNADPGALRARFAIVQTPDQPEGRINLVRHLTPQALWQERFLRHRNNAATLDEVVVAVQEPMHAAARFSRLIGCAVLPDGAGGLVLELTQGRVRIVAGAGHTVPHIPGVTLSTSDGNEALRRILDDEAIAFREEREAVIIDAVSAGGVELRFGAYRAG
jgi:hypothetical protein